MSNPFARPRLIGAIVSSLSAIVLLAALIPAMAFGEEEPPPSPPALGISPVSLPNTTVQTESAPQAVNVVNVGGEEALTESPFIEGPGGSEFKITNNGCGKVFPEEHCTIWVSFAPGSEAGEKEATLVLPSSNAPTATLPLNATAVLPVFEFSPSPLEFGLVRTNNGSSQIIQLTNEGEALARVNWFGFAGSDSGYFGNGNNNCGGAWLEPGQSCFIEVWFNPREMRDYEALLEAHSGSETFTTEVLGSGGSALLEPATNPVALGSVAVGSHGSIQTIELTNVGNMEGGFFIAVIAGGSSASFQLLDENCTGVPIAPSATCVAHVRFAPQAVGPLSARLALFGEGDGGTMIELHGEGIAPAVTLTPSSFDFGAVAPGTRGAPQSFTLRNTGGGSIEAGAASLVGVDPDQFVIAGDECTDATLAGGEECTVRVRFAPDSAGAKTARLRIASGGGPFIAVLSGTGGSAEPKGTEPQSSGNAPAAGNAPTKPRHRRKARFRRNTTIVAARAIR